VRSRCYQPTTARPSPAIIVACAVIEVLFFVGLLLLKPEQFIALVSYPDTESYAQIALELLQSGDLIGSSRTLGYPLFLAMGYLAGGLAYGPYVVIAAQLLIKLVFTWGCWLLLARITPHVSGVIRGVMTLFFFWAGLGMAADLLSDFLAAFLFGTFLFGLLFWRSHRSAIVAATALGLATLVRPTFTFVPLLLPLAGYLAGRATIPVPRRHLIWFAIASLGATGISTAYQYTFHAYMGPSPILAVNIGRTLDAMGPVEGGAPREMGYLGEISARATGPDGTFSANREERAAVELFREEIAARPRAVAWQLSVTFVKYLLAPVESAATKVFRATTDAPALPPQVRWLMGVICLPIWLLAIVPPFGSSTCMKSYYLLVGVIAVMIIGLTSINPFQGERIRFPVLAFMLPVAAWNAASLWAFVSRRP